MPKDILAVMPLHSNHKLGLILDGMGDEFLGAQAQAHLLFVRYHKALPLECAGEASNYRRTAAGQGRRAAHTAFTCLQRL